MQRNLCVKLLREAKREYYKNIDLKSLNDNRTFWKTVKPLFSGKVKTTSSVTLLENDEIVSDDKAVAEILAGASNLLRPFAQINSSSNSALIQLLLYGDKDLSDDINKDILQLTLNFIHRTGRFS